MVTRRKNVEQQKAQGGAPVSVGAADPLVFLAGLVGQLTYARLRFELQCACSGLLPSYLGSTLRGGLASALRKICCALPREECPTCMLRERCHYSVLFETPPDTRLDAWQKQASWPRPIVIQPPDLRNTPWTEGEVLSFDLNLFGRAVQSFPYLVLAASRMAETGLGGRRRPFRLLRVLDVRNDQAPVFAAGQDRVESPLVAPLEIPALPRKTRGGRGRKPAAEDRDSAQPGSAVRVRFVTPTRLFEGGRPLREVDFRGLVKAVLSRASSLMLFHCGGSMDGDPKAVLDAAESIAMTSKNLEWAPLKRWSNRQKQQLDLDGLVGDITFSGPGIDRFWPLLKAGELTHIGKGTVFGLGKVEVEADGGPNG